MIGMMLGKIDMEQVKRVLKIVGGVLLIALTGVFAALSLAVAGSVAAVFLEVVLVEAPLLPVAAVAVAFAVALAGSSGYTAAKIIKNVADRSGVTHEAATLVNKLNDYIQNTVVPAAKRFWQLVRGKIDELRGVKAEAAEENVAETESHAAETAEETEAPAEAEAEKAAEGEDEEEDEDEEATERG